MSLTETLQLVTGELRNKTDILIEVNTTISTISDVLFYINIGLVVLGAGLCGVPTGQGEKEEGNKQALDGGDCRTKMSNDNFELALHRFSTVFIDSTECIDTLLTRVFTLVVIVILLLVVLIFIAFLSLKNVWHRLQKTISPKKYANCD
ncbi:hypothetical protein QR680_004612 [Steinernema hermaphroditum]|uniref:Uncharacterized protein n=1 Tax=Steinernema hermaphroditum TaxID=289476 RepID=A0AA39HP93_9BILA|nr:hypothetical protein QR680_004612 [Steinernema hermaphroditum]